MTWRTRARRRLFWAGVLLGLLLLLASLSVLRAGIWLRDEAARFVSVGRRRESACAR